MLYKHVDCRVPQRGGLAKILQLSNYLRINRRVAAADRTSKLLLEPWMVHAVGHCGSRVHIDRNHLLDQVLHVGAEFIVWEGEFAAFYLAEDLLLTVPIKWHQAREHLVEYHTE